MKSLPTTRRSRSMLAKDEEAGLYVGATKTAVDKDYNQARMVVREAKVENPADEH